MTSTITERQRINTSSAVKVPCKAATTANITLLGEQTIDGVACVTNDRVLVKSQTTASENGIYIVNTSSWSRARDWDGAYDVKKGTFVYVTGGTNSGFWYVTTSDPIIPGTTSVTIAQASSQLLTFSAFAQLLFDDADAAAGRATLGAAADADVVHDTGDETIAGNKTFSGNTTVTGITTLGTATFSAAGEMTAGTVPPARRSFKGVYAYNSSAQSIPNITSTTVQLNTEIYDTDTFHDNATNNTRLTIPSGVSYVRVIGHASFAANATGHRTATLLKNAGALTPNVNAFVQATNSATYATSIEFVSPVLSVIAGDYFELSVTQTSGGALDVSGYLALEVVN